jgi:hypothetical protein
MGMLSDPEGLADSCHRQNGRKAPGVDGVRKADYERGLESRLLDLSSRLRRMGFARQCRGKAFLVRCADDYVVCFEFEDQRETFRLMRSRSPTKRVS